MYTIYNLDAHMYGKFNTEKEAKKILIDLGFRWKKRRLSPGQLFHTSSKFQGWFPGGKFDHENMVWIGSIPEPRPIAELMKFFVERKKKPAKLQTSGSQKEKKKQKKPRH